MVRIGGFLKSQNRIRRQRARGRFISPYQVGGTIFGRSTMMRYPLMHASSRLKSHRKKMKGGTIFGKSTRMHQNLLGFPSAHPEREALEYMMKRMKGGNPFRWLKKRTQIDFPDQLFPFAFPIADLHKTRRTVKRGRR